MLCVPTEVRPSRIHGLGLFLLKSVKKNTLIWHFDSRIDRVYTTEEIESLSRLQQDFLYTYCYLHEDTGTYVLHGDTGRFINHSTRPNMITDGTAYFDFHATANLASGTELTINYKQACDFVQRTGKFA